MHFVAMVAGRGSLCWVEACVMKLVDGHKYPQVCCGDIKIGHLSTQNRFQLTAVRNSTTQQGLESLSAIVPCSQWCTGCVRSMRKRSFAEVASHGILEGYPDSNLTE